MSFIVDVFLFILAFANSLYIRIIILLLISIDFIFCIKDIFSDNFYVNMPILLNIHFSEKKFLFLVKYNGIC
jgi:hypothetical protein